MKQGHQDTPPNRVRRWGWLAALAAVLPQWACSQPRGQIKEPPGSLSPEDAALKHKFRDIRGGELRVDASFVTSTSVIVDADTGGRFNISTGVFGPGKGTTSGYGGYVPGDQLVVPKRLRLIRWAQGAKFVTNNPYTRFEGEPVLDVTVPVAERIPDDVLDRVRQYKGSLRLKLRITPQTLLVGWEVRNGRGYPFKRDAYGNALVTDEDVMIGGDFCERQMINVPINGKWHLIEQKGWERDPKTGQRVEVNY